MSHALWEIVWLELIVDLVDEKGKQWFDVFQLQIIVFVFTNLILNAMKQSLVLFLELRTRTEMWLNLLLWYFIPATAFEWILLGKQVFGVLRYWAIVPLLLNLGGIHWACVGSNIPISLNGYWVKHSWEQFLFLLVSILGITLLRRVQFVKDEGRKTEPIHDGFSWILTSCNLLFALHFRIKITIKA